MINTPLWDYIWVRKSKVKHGNITNPYIPVEQDWLNSAGTDLTDSEWFPLPTQKLVNQVYTLPFTSFGQHGNQQNLEVTSSIATIDHTAKTITMPYGVRRDSVFRIFNFGPNHAWDLKWGKDSSQYYVQTNDSIFFTSVAMPTRASVTKLWFNRQKPNLI